MLDVRSLAKGATHIVVKDFTDFYNYSFARGEDLTFVKKQFLPYHGGHIVVFEQRKLYLLYLQEDINKDILDHLGKYLSLDE